MTHAQLIAAAFGSDPGAWPLPTATTAHLRWLRAVAAGGQGRYASARADLAALLRDAPAGPPASLAHSTRGWLLRQLGWHTLARGADGRALALAGEDPEAVADALIGLAADALGVGRFAVAATVLDRAADGLASPRPAVRWAWVGAELAMAVGDGARAVGQAERAVELAHAGLAGSARHRVKSDVVLAAALCSAGAIERARAVGDAALEAAGRLGLDPLRWALACLLADVGSATRTPQEIGAVRDACAGRIRRRGGTWCDASTG
jgi:tetratricopeptide (TPR) repeat protein